MNSTLQVRSFLYLRTYLCLPYHSKTQALASLTYLQPHIDAIHAKAEVLDVPTPVIDSLQDLFRRT
jgi:hypothetical protein